MTTRHPQNVAPFRDTVKMHPASADAWFNLGKALADAGAYGGAVLAYRRCAELDPEDAAVHYNLGNTLQRAGDTDAAIAAYRAAATRDEGNAAVFINLGIALMTADDPASAVDAFRQALVCDPRSPQAYNNLGNAYSKQALLSRAEEAYRGALRLQPDLADAWYNLGGILSRQGRSAEAEVAYRGALRIHPAFCEACINLAGVVQDLGRTAEAIELLRHAVTLRPSFAEAHFNLALALLQSGSWEEGWKEFEWRTATADGVARHTARPLPRWDGVVRLRETLLVRAEQGYGDTIQCARFLPDLLARGVHVVMECREELHPLFAPWNDAIDLTTPDRPFAGIDREIGMFSLPGILGVTPESAWVPYLHAPAAHASQWRSRVRSAQRLMHVGLVATGNPGHKNDRKRSVPLHELAPLFGTRGVAWHSLLHSSDPMTQAFPAGVPVVHHGDMIHDFGDSSALMENLDLLISVDTAPAHLGGALGIPVWLMLPFNPDWRWLLGREDSPWYPTMRLFRQAAPGAWTQVISRIGEALTRTVSGQHPGGAR